MENKSDKKLWKKCSIIKILIIDQVTIISKQAPIYPPAKRREIKPYTWVISSLSVDK